MSYITNPDTEASVSCGFYNSLNRDRKYASEQMSAIFDGIIKDGIFASIGTCFAVKASSGNIVNVGVGKCWFNHTWTLNDGVLPIDCGESEVLLNRIDAIVVEVDATETVRDNFIKVVKGTPASKPVRPTMIHSNTVNQYALCYIYRTTGSTEITQADITSVIGTDETPFITGILQTVSLDQLLGQWESELDQFVAKEKDDLEVSISDMETEYDTWFKQMKTLMAEAIAEVDTWTENQKTAMLSWFDHMKDQLSEDAAANLQIQVDRNEIKNILMCGLPDGRMQISPDGTVITSTDSTGRTLLKTFTNNYLTYTAVLQDENGIELGKLIKNFSQDGSIIDSTITTLM